MNSLAVRPTTAVSYLEAWEAKKELAGVLIKSGFLPPAFKTPEQVLAVMITAQELGVPEMEGLRSINVIQGKPTVSPQLMLALINRSGQLEDMVIQDNGNACSVTMKRKGRQPHTEVFSMDDADRMVSRENGQTVKLSDKFNWRSMPKIMRKWRAVAACARVVFPDVVSGLYTPEEMGGDVTVTDEGEMVVESTGEVLHAPALPAPDPSYTVVDDRTGTETVERPPDPVTVQGATFQTFDPAVETIGFGKFKGMKWVECEPDYLRWLSGNANKAEIKDKAAAALATIEAVKAQQQEAQAEQGDAFEGAFDKQPTITPEDPAIKASRLLREKMQKAIADAKTVAALGTISKNIKAAFDAGELVAADREILAEKGVARLNTLKPPKGK